MGAKWGAQLLIVGAHMFSFVKDTFKKSEAAAVVQSLLETQQRTGYFFGEPSNTARKLVAKVWDFKPDVFNGTRAGRPHKLSVAAFALATGVTDNEDDRRAQLPCLTALGQILINLNLGNSPYSLNGIDYQLIQLSIEAHELWSA
jgi:hypothetical protein